jgi:hypothetical protein
LALILLDMEDSGGVERLWVLGKEGLMVDSAVLGRVVFFDRINRIPEFQDWPEGGGYKKAARVGAAGLVVGVVRWDW